MFDLIISCIRAYNQIGMFLAALFCLGIGGFILGNALYWRVHAIRATGTIIGVIGSSSYTPVYRYTTPDGQTHEAKSDTGSSSPQGKETGRTVPLLISAHNPAEAREANNYLLDIIGTAFAAPGLWLGYTAITAFPVTPMTGVMTLALLAYIAERARKVFIPKGQRISIDEWKKQHLHNPVPVDLSSVKPIEELVSAPEARAAQQKQYLNNKKAAPIIGVIAALLLCLGVYQVQKIFHLESSGLRAQGEIVSMKEEYNSGSNSGSYVYYPIVGYETAAHEHIEFKDAVGGSHPVRRVGDKVTVLYLADKPQKEAIIDRGLWNWLVPGLLIGFAVLLLCLRRWILAHNEKPVTAT